VASSSTRPGGFSSACISAALGAGALMSAWLLFRKKDVGRVLWLTLCLLAVLYFVLFWSLSGTRVSWTGFIYAGVYALAFIVSLVVLPRRRDAVHAWQHRMITW
jgi:O-antigen ligase